VALWSAGLAAAPGLLAEERAKPLLSVARGADWEKLVLTALEPLGGMPAFVKKGAKVVLKPNIGWDRRPDQAGCTHPAVVKALARACLDAGAARVSVFDRTCNDERRCYATSGIQAALESLNDDRVVVSFLDERKYVPVKIAKGKSVTEWSFYKEALEADCFINVPVAKDHGLSRLTLCLKNVMGVIGGNRGQIHQDMGQRLADLATVLRPTLNVVDATRILMANGPQGGNLADVAVKNTVIASVDPVAADAYATRLFGLKPEDVSSTVAAAAMGLGEMSMGRIRVVRG
jgi:uncharacterized protein (DUF362 family)